MATLPANYDGASEWNRLSASLTELAAVYGTTFPVVEGGPARAAHERQGTREDRRAMSPRARTSSSTIWTHRSRTQNVDTATREAAVKAGGHPERGRRRNWRSTIDDDKPASGEARTLLQHAAAMRTAAAGRTLSAAAKTSWGAGGRWPRQDRAGLRLARALTRSLGIGRVTCVRRSLASPRGCRSEAGCPGPNPLAGNATCARTWRSRGV